MSKLPPELRKMIDQLCQKGDKFAKIDQLDDALDQYEAAWELLPFPKGQWPASTWILMAVGDLYFCHRHFAAARDALREALQSPGGHENEFLWLRLGQSLYELEDLNGAADAFETAFRLNGEELFVDEDPKYLSFLRTQRGLLKTQSPPRSSRFNRPLQQIAD